ncbi:MAG: hypothetical protein AAB956_03380 [Patescibacteria group bacterium]
MKEQLKFTPEPAASFRVEYLNARGMEIHNAMAQMGFSFRHSEATPDESEVHFEGDSHKGDGTKIKITITKGENYKSPAEIAKEKEAEEESE